MNKSFALGIVVVFIAFFMIMVFGVMRFSSHEMYSTGQMALQKKAEMLALSGINIADMALDKGRWYQPPISQQKTLMATGKSAELRLNHLL